MQDPISARKRMKESAESSLEKNINRGPARIVKKESPNKSAPGLAICFF